MAKRSAAAVAARFKRRFGKTAKARIGRVATKRRRQYNLDNDSAASSLTLYGNPRFATPAYRKMRTKQVVSSVNRSAKRASRARAVRKYLK